MEIELNEAEQAIAKYLAKRRYRKNRTKGVENRRIGPQSDWETDLNGIGAELACCKMFNIYPDLSTNVRRGGYDCISPKGHKIDVKATKYKTGRLLAVEGKTGGDADIYVLMIGEFPSYRCAGWATSEEMLADDNLIDLGYGPTHALQQSELREI